MNIKRFFLILAKPHVIFIIIALISGTFFCILTPPFWGLDEPSHFARAYQIARGELLPSTGANNRGGLMPDNFMEMVNYRTNDILDGWNNGNVLESKDVTDQSVYSRLGDKRFTKSQHFYLWTATYSPISYPGSTIGIVISNIFGFSILQTLFMARFFSLISYIVLAAFAIWLVRKIKLKWLFLSLALIPTAIFQVSTVTADTVLLGLSLIFMALFCRITIDTTKDKRLIYGLAVVAILLPLIKINYIFMSLGFLIIPNKNFITKKVAYIFKSITTTFAVAFSLVWTWIASVMANSVVSQRADGLQVMPKGQIIYILHNPLNSISAFIKSLILKGNDYYQQQFFTISGNSIGTPVILTIILSVVLLICAFYAKDELQKMRKQIILLSIAAAICAMSIFVTLYICFCPVGWWYMDGVQGRYFTPILAVFAMLFAVLIPATISMKKHTLIVIVSVAAVVSLVVSIIYNLLALY